MTETITVRARAWCQHCEWRETGDEQHLRHEMGVHELFHPGGPRYEQLEEQDDLGLAPVPADPAATEHADDRPARQNGAWPPELIVERLQAYITDLGRVPTRREVDAEPSLPSSTTIALRFGSWAHAVEAAGFERPTRGHRRPRATAVDPDPPAPPTGNAPDASIVDLAERVVVALAAVDAGEAMLDQARRDLATALEALESEIGHVWPHARGSASPATEPGNEP